MKKFLGVSFAAILAVAPMVARAADDPTTPIAPVTIAANETVGVASTKYVKEAYNAMAGKVNTELAKKQDVIDATHKLDADSVDDTTSTHKFVTAEDKTTWSGKQNALSSDQLAATNSGITAAKVGTYDGYATGKQDTIDTTHKLSADLVDDTSTTHKFVTAAEKSTWGGKQDRLTAGKGVDITSNKVKVDAGTGLSFDGDGDDAKLIVSGLKNAQIASDAAIAKTKLASDVQTSLGKADDAANQDLSNLSATGKANVSAVGTYDSTANYTAGTVGAAIKGKQDVIDADHKLAASNIDGLAAVATSGNASDLTTDTTHRLVTDSEKSAWNAKQAALSAGDGIDMTGNVVKVKADDGLTFDTSSKKLKVDLGSGLAINSTSKKVDVSGITSSNIAANAGITGTQLAANAGITGSQLAANAGITGSQLAANAGITGTQLAANAAIAKTQLASDVQTSLGKADKVGTVTSLTTTKKTDLVSAINEVNGKVLTIYSGWNNGGTPGTTSTVTLTTPAS